MEQLFQRDRSRNIPAWSPRREKFALFSATACCPYCNGDMFVVNPDGSGRTKLTYTPTPVELFHDWSPDGIEDRPIHAPRHVRNSATPISGS